MTRPTILSSSEVKFQEKPFPVKGRTMPHKWLTRRSLLMYGKQERYGFEIFLSKLAEEKIRNHAMSRLDPPTEIMGLLLGSVYTHEGKEYIMIRDIATTDLDASLVSVRFDREGFEKLFDSLEDSCFDYIIVGWYHSHPGHRCFLSQTDIDTQTSMFTRKYHTALVIDPVNHEIEAFGVEGGGSFHRPFTMYWDEFQNPYYGESVRKRTLEGV